MRDHEVKMGTIDYLYSLFIGRRFAECLERVNQEYKYMNGERGWSPEYPMTRSHVESQLAYFKSRSEDLLIFE